MADLSVVDYALAQNAGKHIHLGRAFAFLTPHAMAHPALAWVSSIFGVRGPMIVPLAFGRKTALPGAMVEGASVPPLELAAVTSDKSVYREGKDVVHLCLVNLARAGRVATLVVSSNGAPFDRRPVPLDDTGLAHVELRDLPVADYEVRWDERDAAKDAPPCTFTVATYRLAPLVAQLEARTMRGEQLDVRLRLTSFGAPVDGAVTIELHDGRQRTERVRATAEGGLVQASVRLRGEGPHALVVALEADPSKTATVPIVGSRASERSETVLSKLGTEWYGSLLPTEGARPVRGMFLREDPVLTTTPVRLERVDASTVRLRAMTPLGRTCVVVSDPTFPARAPGAVDPAAAKHPAHEDEAYVVAEKAFQSGDVAGAQATFAAARAKRSGAPHPNYAYYLACCAARLGQRSAALGWLRQAVRDGWDDFAHLGTDEDLSALRGDPAYEALAREGRVVVTRDAVAEGEVIEIATSAPLSIVTVGAFVGRGMWEGWAVVVDPRSPAISVEVPPEVEPGTTLRAVVTTTARSAYVVVKDARLPSADTPEAKLAGEMKRTAAACEGALRVGKPEITLAAAAEDAAPPYGSLPGGATMPPMMMRATMMGGPPLPAPPRSSGLGRMMPFAQAAMPAPTRGAGAPSREMVADHEAAAPAPYREAAPRTTLQIAEDEPEVLFAGVVACEAGRATVEVALGNGVADYVVEAFALAGGDWASAEARFRADKPTFASLQVPAFVSPGDAAVAQLHFGAGSGRARVRVTRDGADVPLVFEGQPVRGDLAAARGSVAFLAEEGDYEAIVDDGAGHVERVWARVDRPGRIRRRVKTLVFLRPGEQVSTGDDPSIVGLRVMPGLDKPFTALVNATADYGHACCEQTAAKMMSAAAMYVMSAAKPAERARAASIVEAGVRRERQMFLPGRGFKMYPESRSDVDAYWGPKAARYLHYLAPLREVDPSPSLAAAVDEGVRMGREAASAYGLAIPSKKPDSADDAYATAVFGDGATQGRALEVALGIAQTSARSRAGDAVGMRADLAYASATLLRAGGTAHVGEALRLANAVVAAIGEQGRLYSTVDSIAAVAMMSELGRARVVSGSARFEVDGREVPVAAAVALEPASVRAVEGVCVVEVTRQVEEDWNALRGDATLRVWLEKKGRPARDVSPLDAVDLRVQVTSGYKTGDLLWVQLPDALSRIVGGGQVKRFSVDFTGASELTIPLAVTGVTVDRTGAPGTQRFAVALRNMFEEERGAAATGLEVAVVPDDDASGPISRAVAALKGIFG